MKRYTHKKSKIGGDQATKKTRKANQTRLKNNRNRNKKQINSKKNRKPIPNTLKPTELVEPEIPSLDEQFDKINSMAPQEPIKPTQLSDNISKIPKAQEIDDVPETPAKNKSEPATAINFTQEAPIATEKEINSIEKTLDPKPVLQQNSLEKKLTTTQDKENNEKSASNIDTKGSSSNSPIETSLEKPKQQALSMSEQIANEQAKIMKQKLNDSVNNNLDKSIAALKTPVLTENTSEQNMDTLDNNQKETEKPINNSQKQDADSLGENPQKDLSVAAEGNSIAKVSDGQVMENKDQLEKDDENNVVDKAVETEVPKNDNVSKAAPNVISNHGVTTSIETIPKGTYNEMTIKVRIPTSFDQSQTGSIANNFQNTLSTITGGRKMIKHNITPKRAKKYSKKLLKNKTLPKRR